MNSPPMPKPKNRRVYTSITTRPSGYEARSTHNETDRRSKDCPWCGRKESQPGGTRGFRSSSDGPFGPALRGVPAAENRRRYLLSTSALRNRSNVAGLRIAASFATRLGRTNRAIRPNTKRPTVVRGGPRRRERPLTISWCFSNRDSALTERTPPGRALWEPMLPQIWSLFTEHPRRQRSPPFAARS